MKALILNSGIGKRMGIFTDTACKCFAEVAEGVTILDLQLRLLIESGITEVCITTGPFASNLENYTKERYPNVKFHFVHNPLYDKTNYIYSIHLAAEILQDDILLLHGDLVFEHSVLLDILSAPCSVMVTDVTRPLPLKDFKAVVANSRVKRVGINEFCEGSHYAQPMYKLMKTDWLIWLSEINRFCLEGKVDVYAEDALNNISHNINLYALDIDGRICFEIDNIEDLEYGIEVYRQFLIPAQTIYEGFGCLSEISNSIFAKAKKIFAVGGSCLKSIALLLPSNTIFFSEFTPNPDFDDVLKGIELFESENCDFIVSIGGGSTIDVAKSINVLRYSKDSITLLENTRCKHLAIPTTAGTGSESTCFAVIYKNGEKQSVEHKSALAEYVVLDPSFLTTLPLYHKKSTVLDALCQAIESIWAKGATVESKGYAKRAIGLILDNIDLYLEGGEDNARYILIAANLSGKAINISKTTAAHAMSYKLSSKFEIAHGHAVAVCLPYVWQHLISECKNTNQSHIKKTLNEISGAMGLKEAKDALDTFLALLNKLDMAITFDGNDSVITELLASINPQRLANHPVAFQDSVLEDIYRKFISY